ncbi:MAG: T9SS type A sorting domain-containing protein, partial [Ignavibacteria bacterium]|nr:T9SS type A sorting domain-containing protein [Ignavibacteria bacterium]
QNTLVGTVTYHRNPDYPIQDAQVMMYNQQDQLIATATTNEEGIYVFNNVPDGTFNLRTTTSLDGAQITLSEAYLIWLYTQGIEQLDDIQYLAADVNDDEVVSEADLEFITANYFVFNQPFPAGDWVFEEIEVSTSSRDGASNIGGSRIGDIEGVFVPTGRDIVNQYIITEKETEQISIGSEIIVPVYAQSYTNAIGAYGLVLDYDPALIEVLEVLPFGSGAVSSVQEKSVRIAYLPTVLDAITNYNGKVADIKIRVLANYNDAFFAFTIGKESHILDNNGIIESGLEYGMLKLKTISDLPDIKFNIYPNPATTSTTVRIESGFSTNAEIQLFNQSGQMVQSENIQLQEGINEIKLPLDHFKSGMYQIIVKNGLSEIVVNQRIVLL